MLRPNGDELIYLHRKLVVRYVLASCKLVTDDVVVDMPLSRDPKFLEILNLQNDEQLAEPSCHKLSIPG